MLDVITLKVFNDVIWQLIFCGRRATIIAEICLLLLGETMSKKQILGVVALLSVAAISLSYNTFINCEQVVAGNIFADEKAEFEQALKRAEEAKKLAETYKSELYPGLDEYITSLIGQAGQYGDYKNTEEVTAALNEAAEAIPYLLGINRREATVSTNDTRSSRDATGAESKIEVKTNEPKQVAQTEVQARVENEAPAETTTTNNGTAVKTETEPVANNDLGSNGATKQVEAEGGNSENEDAPEEVAELPNTGVVEESKMSYAGLIIAGVAVIISTVVASIVVVAAKRKM